jgi:hypothetical protein
LFPYKDFDATFNHVSSSRQLDLAIKCGKGSLFPLLHWSKNNRNAKNVT